MGVLHHLRLFSTFNALNFEDSLVFGKDDVLVGESEGIDLVTAEVLGGQELELVLAEFMAQHQLVRRARVQPQLLLLLHLCD
mmetsp:Transcript_23719/g.23412  ORF Transcript_23719/g.23412 Transcript_23719/m.23412 type:complete len:82 (-) Transcript_23719:382-627(-)